MNISIAYLLMRMPAPSEVFLSVEVSSLVEKGVAAEVFCLRNPHSDHTGLAQAQGLADIPIYNFPYFFSLGLWRDVRFWLRRDPKIFWSLVIQITRTGWRRPLVWLKSLLIIPKSFSIARIISEKNIRVVHAAWGHYPAVTGYLVKQLVPSIHFTLGLGAYDRIAQHPMTVIATSRADCVLTQGNTSKDLLKHHWPKPECPILVIRRGINIDRLREIRKNTKKVSCLVVSGGNLKKNKGHQHVIKAFSNVISDFPEARLMIIGDGFYRSKLMQLVTSLHLEDYVKFTGHLNQADLFYYMARSSAFVLASESRTDNLPNVIKEAMALGTPVITTPTTGIEELVQDQKTGCIVGMGDTTGIYENVRKIFRDQSFSEYLSKNALNRVEETFDIKETTQQRVDLLKELAYSSREFRELVNS